MKKRIIIFLIMLACSCLLISCSNAVNIALPKGNIIEIHITSQPYSDSYERIYTDTAKITAVAEYLNGLSLKSNFPEDPNDGYDGMSYIITVSYEDGTSDVYCHAGNMFFGQLKDPPVEWYRMTYDEAAELYNIIQKNPSDERSVYNEPNPGEPSFAGIVEEVYSGSILVRVNEGEDARRSSDLVYVPLNDNAIKFETGDGVVVYYDGTIMESYPAQLSVVYSIVRTHLAGAQKDGQTNVLKDNQSNGNVPLIFEITSTIATAPTPPEFTCAECGAYCNAYNQDSLCGLCHLPAGTSANIWNLGTSGIELEIRKMICKDTDTYHGGSAIMALPGGYDELLELYALFLTQDEKAIVERLKKIPCARSNCACPYRTQAALNSIFTDFLDMTEIRFPVLDGPKPTQVYILHEGHNNKINISYGLINGMNFTVAVHPIYSSGEGWIKDWLASLSPIRTIEETEIYLSQEPSEPKEEFSYRGITHAYFNLNVNGQYIEVYVSKPPCEMPPAEEMTGNWWEYRCKYCNNLSQGPRCYGAPVDVQAALDVIVQFDFRTLP